MTSNKKDSTMQYLTLDPDKYREKIEDMKLNTQQEDELLTILWNIMSTMVEIGFGQDSVQTVLDSFVKSASPDLPSSIKRNETPNKTHHDLSDTAYTKDNHYE